MTAALFAAAAVLAGVIDMHVHSDPDSVPRSLSAIQVARLAKDRGMRGLVLKNHFESTAGLAWLARQEVPGLEVFGGIDLNGTVGGLNPAAVEQMVKVKGGYGKVIWLPTFDAEHDTLAAEHPRPRIPVARGGELLPAVKTIISLAAKHNLTLETGHSAPEEALAIVREARKAGVRNVVVTHAMMNGLSIPQMAEAAAGGAWIEFVFNGLIGAGKKFEISDYARAIRTVGPAHCILASDLGQAGNPYAPDGLILFFSLMAETGFTEDEIRLMSATNPAKALGLE